MKSALITIIFISLLLADCALGECAYFERQNIGIASQSNAVFAGEFNGNNYTDLAVVNNNLAAVTVLYDYDGNDFMDTVHYGIGNSMYGMTGADFDLDNDLDLAVVGHNPGCVYILTNYSGLFEVDTIEGVGDGIYAVYTDYLNDDEYYDLVTANSGSNNVSVLLNNGDGTFAAPVRYDVDYWPRDVCGGDFDSDNDVDLALANHYYDQVSIMLNNGDGTFAGQVDYPVEADPRSVCSADFDGDNDIDLAVACMETHRMSVLLNDGNAIFDDTLNYGQAYAIYIDAVDIDSDSDIDIAVASYGAVPGTGSVDVFHNEGDGSFRSSCIHYGAGSGTRRFCVYDLDGDGDLDIPTANAQSEYISILKNEPYIGGDVNEDDAINILDITFLIEFVYMEGPAPDPQTSGSFNGNCGINILDITYLIEYIYLGGPEPICP